MHCVPSLAWHRRRCLWSRWQATPGMLLCVDSSPLLGVQLVEQMIIDWINCDRRWRTIRGSLGQNGYHMCWECGAYYLSHFLTILMLCSYVQLQEIFRLFDNANCPSLQNKPKMFFIQACRGGKWPSESCGVWASLISQTFPLLCSFLSTLLFASLRCKRNPHSPPCLLLPLPLSVSASHCAWHVVSESQTLQQHHGKGGGGEPLCDKSHVMHVWCGAFNHTNHSPAWRFYL